MPCSTKDDFWWDTTWNPVSGCRPCGPGCLNCYAPFYAVTHTHPWRGGGLHAKVAERYGPLLDVFRFNEEIGVVPPGHQQWDFPLRYAGATHPKLGDGQPSLIFVGSMSDLFYEKRPTSTITETCVRISMSNHIGLLLSRRTHRMSKYFLGLDERTVNRWQPKMWLGFSAEDQRRFNKRWPPMLKLAQAGWRVFVSVAPMISPVVLPASFLQFGAWTIVSGEIRCKQPRHMNPTWARAVRDQCAEAGIPFYLLQMTQQKPVPPDLQVRQFPSPPFAARP